MPDPQSVRGKEADERPFYPQATRLMFVDAAETIVRPIGRILRQPRFPCCTGQGIAGGIDWRLLRDNRRHPRTSERVWVSGVSVWREARRRARGTVADITAGAYAWAALDGVAHRGWDPWRPGEDTDTEEAGAGAPPAGDDLQDELWAGDTRHREMPRWRVTETNGYDLWEAVHAALSDPTLEVVFGGGCRDGFFNLRPHPDAADVIVTSEERGGDTNGHLERIFGVTIEDGRPLALVQGSWSEGFAGCHLPDGRFQRGCYKADVSVLAAAWDAHVFQAVT